MAQLGEAGLSRRGLLKKAAVGTAVVGALAVTPTLVQQPDAEYAATVVPETTLEGPMVVFVRDATKGELSIMVGTDEIVRTDPALVAQLVRLSGSQSL